MGLVSVFLLFVRAILLRLLQCLQIFLSCPSLSLENNSGSKTSFYPL